MVTSLSMFANAAHAANAGGGGSAPAALYPSTRHHRPSTSPLAAWTGTTGPPFFDGLTQLHPLSDGRRDLVDSLLADNGRGYYPTGGEAWTPQKIAANVTEMKEVINGEDQPDVWYTTGQGRYQVGARDVVFFYKPGDRRDPVRASAVIVERPGATRSSATRRSTTCWAAWPRSPASRRRQPNRRPWPTPCDDSGDGPVTPTASVAGAAAQVKCGQQPDGEHEHHPRIHFP